MSKGILKKKYMMLYMRGEDISSIEYMHSSSYTQLRNSVK